MEQTQDCETCYKIICKNCNWTASKEEELMIQKGELTNCPMCNWKPN